MKTFLIGVALLMGGPGAYVEIRLHEDERPVASTAMRPGAATFSLFPIPAEWVGAGDPITEIAKVLWTHGGSAQVYLWRTTASTFRWIHHADEIITVLDGDVYITGSDGTRHHLRTGYVAHFPVGSVQLWEVPKSLLESAIRKHRIPTSVEAEMRWIRQALAIVSSREAVHHDRDTAVISGSPEERNRPGTAAHHVPAVACAAILERVARSPKTASDAEPPERRQLDPRTAQVDPGHASEQV